MTKSTQRTTPQRPDRRLTIGLLADRLGEEYQSGVLDGIMEAAEKRDVNLLCISGRALRLPYGFEAQCNVLYDLVGVETVDGLLVMGGSLCHFISPEEIRYLYHERYHPLPVVSIALEVEGVPSVLVDNVRGIRDLVGHLIEAHGYHRIAFIRGPEGSPEAELRYHAYCDALAEHGLPLDPNLVAPGDFNPPSGREAVSLFLDQRKVDLEAIVASNDGMALGALEALQARGIDVPGAMALAGFDDVEAATSSTPPLTTVRQPLHALGRQAVELLLARLAGEEVSEHAMLPTDLVVRRSCGCISQTVIEAGVTETARVKKPFTAAFPARRQQILSAMAQAVEPLPGSDVPGWMEQLLDGFVAALTAGKAEGFLSTLDSLLRQVVTAGGDVAAWQGVLSAMHREVLPLLSDKTRLQAEGLCQQARVLVGETAQRVQINRRLEAEQRVLRLGEISQTLATSASLEELVNVMAQQLPRLGINSCYVSLYDGAGTPPEWSRLILAYDERGRIEVGAGGRRFPTRQLVPSDLWPQGRRYSMAVEALHFRENQLGIALFEIGSQERTIYEALRVQISSGLQGVLLLEERRRAEMALKRRALQLQTAAEVSRTASGILDPDELSRQVVELARERFDLYYAGLFLVDQTGEWTGEPGKWAVLRAGTGAAGQKMLEQGHKLEIGGASMIGWCIANKQARIALDVGEEAVRFENPLLPQTRSELALPLVSRGEAIGALTIQSAQEAAFSPEDITVLQTMADQLANAITNARLFEQARTRAEELAVLAEMARALTMTLDLGTVLENVYHHTSRLIDTTNFYIALYDAQKDEVSFPFYQVEGERIGQIASRRGGKGLTEYVIRTRQPLLLKENIAAHLKELGIEMIGREAQSWLGAPMLIGDQVLGVIAVQSYTTPRMYNEHHRDLLSTIANQTAIALQNLRLFNEQQQVSLLLSGRVKELDCLNDIGRKIDESPPIPDLLEWVAERIPPAMQHPEACVVAIEFEGQVYGTPEAVNLPRQMVGSLRIGDERLGQVCIAYTEEHDFLDEESALLGDVVRRLSGYIESRRLLAQTRAALQEVEATHRRYLRQAWSEYLQATGPLGYEVRRPDVPPLGDAVLPEVRQAMEQQRAVVVAPPQGDDASALVAPITLRGTVIGALGIHAEDGARQWSEDEIALVEAIAERVAQVAENLRLLDETQRRAARERLAREITDRMRRATNVEKIVQTAVDELFSTLGTSRAFVRLGVAPSPQEERKSGG